MTPGMRKATDAAAWPFQRGAAAFLVAVAFDAARGGSRRPQPGVAAALPPGLGFGYGARHALVAIFAAMSVAVFSARSPSHVWPRRLHGACPRPSWHWPPTALKLVGQRSPPLHRIDMPGASACAASA